MIKTRKRVFTAFLGLIAAVACFAGVTACSDAVENVVCSFVTYDDRVITVSGAPDSEVVFPTVERDGYAFDGWFTTPEYTGDSVTSARFTVNTTYYAKWTAVYTAELDLDGGELAAGNSVKIRLGANIKEAMNDHTPTKGEYKFGGWYIGDEPLDGTEVMTAAGVKLTARYMAKYVVNVYLQNVDLETYDYKAEYITDYALIDEELIIPVNISGYSVTAEDSDALVQIIDEDTSKNVYSIHLDRRTFNLILNANYPDGTSDSATSAHVYGVEFDMPENTFVFENSRFVGWALTSDGKFEDIITADKYALERNTMLYAVWNTAYTDMFGGADLIFVTPGDNTTATLCRGGVDIKGTYDERRNWYDFESETTDLAIHARLSDNGTFLYYTNRKGTYSLVSNNYINTNITIVIDDYNGVTRYDRTSGNESVLRGTYSVSEEGYFIASMDDGSEFSFLIGVATTSNGQQNIYRVRGEEYTYGVMAMSGEQSGYPYIVLDGFGNALMVSPSSSGQLQQSVVSYSITGDKLTLIMSNTEISLRIYNNGRGGYWYEVYTEAFDTVYWGNPVQGLNSDKLVTDGGGNAEYYINVSTASDVGNLLYSGRYEVMNTVRGGYLMKITEANGTLHTLRVYPFLPTISYFEVLDNDYAEYNYIGIDGSLAGIPYFINYGDGKGALYERNDDGAYLVSQGTLEEQSDGTYLYSVTSVEDVDSENKNITALVIDFDTVSSGNNVYSVYYWISSTGESGTASHVTAKYTAADKSTLELVSGFAIYTDAEGNRFSGVYGATSTYSQLSYRTNGGVEYKYFLLNDEDRSFELLSTVPVRLTRRDGNTTKYGYTLTMTGRSIEEGNGDGKTVKFEAVYEDATDANSPIQYHGYFTSYDVTALDVNASVCTFISDNGAIEFKFLIRTSGTRAYFAYFELDAEIELTAYTAINDSDAEDTTIKLTVLGELSGKDAVLKYTNGTVTVKGTIDARDYTAFDAYDVVIYTFRPLDTEQGAQSFEFTVLSNRFRICAESKTYGDDDGATLEVDGPSHIARYVTSGGETYENRYIVEDNVLSTDFRSIGMYIGDVYRYFDLTAGDKFVLRGLEAATYIVINNGNITDNMFRFDGHGNVTVLDISGDDAVEIGNGTYSYYGDRYTVKIGSDEVYVGKCDTLQVSSTSYVNIFRLEIKDIAGTYFCKEDMTVLELDDVGRVTYYGSMGATDSGTYVRITDNMFYYENSDSTSGAMYTIGGNIITAADYHATYYAADLRSVVFYINGIVRFNNDGGIYYSFDKATNKLYTYVYEPENVDANDYGFVRTEFVISTESRTDATGASVTVSYIMYDDVKYTYFDGKYITLIDDGGNKLEFQPTGAAEFQVVATYTPFDSDKKSSSMYVVTEYDDEGGFNAFIAWNGSVGISGSSNAYNVMVNQDLTVDLDNGSFVYNPDKATFGLTAYDYNYMSIVSVYGSSVASLLFGRYYGAIGIVGDQTVTGTGDDREANITYTLNGRFNFVLGTDGEPLSFTDGKISSAGYVNERYGHLFMAEFTGSDGSIYHMQFFITLDKMTGTYTYIIYALTRADGSPVDCGNGTLVYNETFLYTTGFQIQKGTDAETGEPVYYESGDRYLPTLVYKGELVNAIAVGNSDTEENVLMFHARVYSGRDYDDYYYYFHYTVDEEGEYNGGTVSRRSQTSYSTENANPDHVFVLVDEDGKIVEVFALRLGENTVRISECVKNDDGTFTVKGDNNTSYKISFVEKTSGDKTVTYAVIEPIEDESAPDSNPNPDTAEGLN